MFVCLVNIWLLLSTNLLRLPGRGTPGNPGNRFERLHVEFDGDAMDDLIASGAEAAPGRPVTQYLRDFSQTIISRNESPDIRFDASLNPYRGCEHGCAYCYARPYHEYLGFSAGLDFETRIMVKEEASQLLRKELSARSWKPQPLACSGVTDRYQPIEKKLRDHPVLPGKSSAIFAIR